MRIALAQLNVVVGDLDGNVERIRVALGDAARASADLVVLPELAVTGYPPEDLLLRPGFVRAAREAVDEVARSCTDVVALVGAPAFDRDLANAAFVCADGRVQGVYRKHFLPNYGVFDEHRYFARGRDLLLLEMGDVLVGPTICEDVWQPGPPATDLALAGSTLLVNLSASPFHVGKAEDREEMLVTRARDNAMYVAFCNLVGGQDELVFDGHSVVLDDEGEVIARAPGFEEALLVVDVDPTEAIGRRLRDVRRRELERTRPEPPAATTIRLAAPTDATEPLAPTLVPFASELEQMRLGLGLGLGDYARKNGFGDVVIGISGGIDSALTAAIAADTLGARARPHRLDALPLLFGGDAGRRARGEREPRRRLPRDPDRERGRLDSRGARRARRARGGEPPGADPGRDPDGAFEHARMAGARDRQQVGDGGRLRDDLRRHGRRLRAAQGLFKTDVFRLARHLNERAGREVIPVTTIERPPSAELRADQRDDQSLPPYDVLDPILEAYVELDRSPEELEEQFDPEVVARTLRLVDGAEYKRRQAAPGVKLRPRAFGRDWRTPITNRWRG